MKIEKKVIDEIKRCYSTNEMEVGKENYFFFASEDPNVKASLYKESKLDDEMELWKDAGGCMSLIPFRHNEFLAVQEFYLKVTPSLSKLVWGKYEEDKGWEIKDLFHLPYLHRFDILNQSGKMYLLCATIADSKENKEDWSKSGKIYGAKLPENLEDEIELEVLVDGVFRNHGYSRGISDGKECGYFTSDQGVIQILAPEENSKKWVVNKIADGAISEAVFIDLDGDGVEEMMTIEPFHGNQIKIYKNKNGRYECDYIYPHKIDFAHALVADTILGKPSFIAGIRREDAELVVIQKIGNEYKEILIDKQGGPANLKVVHRDGYDLILAANHTRNEAAVYRISEEE
ncbi:MAG: hypothetical protein ACK5LZ_02515 [Anaerorhabdus sp.]